MVETQGGEERQQEGFNAYPVRNLKVDSGESQEIDWRRNKQACGCHPRYQESKGLKKKQLSCKKKRGLKHA